MGKLLSNKHLMDDVRGAETRKFCRLCLSVDGQFESCNRQVNPLLVEMIDRCLDIRVGDDGLPDSICRNCYITTETFDKFRSLCKQNDVFLREKCYMLHPQQDLPVNLDQRAWSPKTGGREEQGETQELHCRTAQPMDISSEEIREKLNLLERKERDITVPELEKDWEEDGAVNNTCRNSKRDSDWTDTPWRLKLDINEVTDCTSEIENSFHDEVEDVLKGAMFDKEQPSECIGNIFLENEDSECEEVDIPWRLKLNMKKVTDCTIEKEDSPHECDDFEHEEVDASNLKNGTVPKTSRDESVYLFDENEVEDFLEGVTFDKKVPSKCLENTCHESEDSECEEVDVVGIDESDADESATIPIRTLGEDKMTYPNDIDDKDESDSDDSATIPIITVKEEITNPNDVVGQGDSDAEETATVQCRTVQEDKVSDSDIDEHNVSDADDVATFANRTVEDKITFANEMVGQDKSDAAETGTIAVETVEDKISHPNIAGKDESDAEETITTPVRTVEEDKITNQKYISGQNKSNAQEAGNIPIRPVEEDTTPYGNVWWNLKVSKTSDGKWMCNFCNNTKRLLGHMVPHVARHYILMPSKCEECDKVISSPSRHRYHVAKHVSASLVLGYPCRHCPKSFRLKHLLVKHTTMDHVHHDNGNVASSKVPAALRRKLRLRCGRCPRIFKTSLEAEQHYESCVEPESSDGTDLSGNESWSMENNTQVEENSDSSSDVDGSLKDTNRKEKIFNKRQCYICHILIGKQCEMQTLIDHVKTQHNCDLPFKCPVSSCGKLFSTYPLFTLHQLSHKGDFTCEKCPLKFKYEYDLMAHLLKHSVDRFVCDSCGQSIKTEASLRYHRKVAHGIDTYVECPTCSQRFQSKRILSMHAKEHRRKKLMKCSKCSEVFQAKKSLLVHLQQHTRWFRCVYCSKRYLSRRNLQVHELSYHKIKSKTT